MGWKNVKEHYRIGHIVAVVDGCICIGSDYVSDLIHITSDGKVEWGRLGPSRDDDLARYYKEMTADPAKLRELIASPDTFARSISVFTWEEGNIVEHACENPGWPNPTHGGRIQYAGSFSTDKEEVVQWAKNDAGLGIRYAKERIHELNKEMEEARARLAQAEANLAKLNADYPVAAIP